MSVFGDLDLKAGFHFPRGHLKRLLGIVLPAQCMACRAPVEDPGRLCGACWQGVHFITAPQCARCGLPFAFDEGPAVLCGGCTAHPPRFHRARAVMRYGDVAASLVIGLKHADRLHFVPTLGEWLARAGAPLLDQAQVIVPVPLHRWRLLGRRYNQSALLARSVSRLTGVPLLVDGLIRKRATPPQTRLRRSQRLRNVRGAFTVSAARRGEIADRHILLIDDVMTTGATAEACAKALMDAGAGQVDLLTLARVVSRD